MSEIESLQAELEPLRAELQQKDAEIVALLARASDAEAQAFSRGVELAEVRGQLQQANERVGELERLLRESICEICHYAYGEDADDRRNQKCDEGNCKAASVLLGSKPT